MKQKARVTVIKRRIEAWLMALAMVFSVVMIPGGVAKADKPADEVNYVKLVLGNALSVDISGGTATVRYENGTISVPGENLHYYSEDDANTGTTHILYTTSTSLTFTAVPGSGYTAYYDLRDNQGEQEMPDNSYTANSLEVGSETQIDFSFRDSNSGGGEPAADIKTNIAIKKKGTTTYIVKDGELEEGIGENYLLTMAETGEYSFPTDNRQYADIGLKEDQNRYVVIIDGFDDADAELIINGNGVSIESAGMNAFKSIVLGERTNLEIRPGSSLPGNEENNNSNMQSDKPITTIELNVGVYAEGGVADRFGLRDDVKLVIGKDDGKVDNAFKNIKTVELYNYDFHKHGNYDNNEIYATNAFTNVGVVECYYSYSKVSATNLFSGSVTTYNGPDAITIKGTFEIFQEARLTYNSDISIQEGAKILDRYYDHYPDNSQPFTGVTKNAGIIAYDQSDNNGLFVRTLDLTAVAKNSMSSDSVTDNVYHYIINKNQSDSIRTITSTDPIIYSVMYNVDDDGDGSKTLSYNVVDENNQEVTKEIILENGNCGQVEMKNFEKGYYVQDGSHGKFEAWIAADQDVTVVIMPDVGYQYVANTLNINGSIVTGVEPNEAVGQYSFTMFKSAGHISAGFKKTKDVVVVSEDAAVSGVSITGAEKVIEAGNVKLEVADANVGEDDKAAISAAANSTGAEYEYVDFTLNQYVVKNYDESKDAQEAWEAKLTELKDNVSITLDIPDDLSGASSYQVVRLHDGEANVLPVTHSLTNNTLKFDTDKFSTYAIVANRYGDSSTQTGLDYSTPSSGTVKLDGTTVTIENAVISGDGYSELCLYGKEYGKTPMTLVVKGTNTVDTLIFDTAVTVVCEEGASLTFNASKSDLEADNTEYTGTKGSYTLGANTVLEGNVFRYKAAASGGGEQQPTQPAQPAVNPPAAEQPKTAEQPKAAEVGETITGAATSGASATATFTVTEKSTGASDAGEVAYTGESADSTATAVTIPATVTGADGTVYEVTKVADNALKGNKTVKEVTVGDNIEEIGVGAFQNATNLTTVKLGKKVAKIDKNSFAGCTKLKKVTSSGGAVTSIGESAFKGDKALTSVDFSKSKVKTIGKNAFNGDKKLNTIKLNGNAITKVGKGAFKNIKKKATITIYAKDKKTYNKVVKLIKKSGASSVKYKYKKKK